MLFSLVVGVGVVAQWERGSPFLNETVAASPVIRDSTPTRIVSLLPSLTEILFAIGAGHRVVGVSDFADFPPEVKQLARVGGGMTPNLEAIVSLKPDLILVDASNHVSQGAVKRLKDIGQPVQELGGTGISNFGDLFDLIIHLGQLTGSRHRARQVVEEMRLAVEQVHRKVRGIKPVTVYYELWSDPLTTTGDDMLQGNILHLAGGRNIAASLPGRAPKIGTEFLLQHDPEVILLPDRGPRISAITARPGWEHLRAVKEGRVYIVTSAFFSRTGPRSIEALQEIARLLHPELTWD